MTHTELTTTILAEARKAGTPLIPIHPEDGSLRAHSKICVAQPVVRIIVSYTRPTWCGVTKHHLAAVFYAN